MHKILIIEDERDIRETLRDILEIKGFEVSTAKNGKVGMDLITENNLDLVICDVNMPVMDGFEVLTRLKNKCTENQHPPFIFLTAKVERGDLNKGLSLGAKHYITKPFSNKEILKAIESSLNQGPNQIRRG